ncbi:TRAP dicarboxylate transporter, DctM subunit [Oceaniovalibus guishaninsula JLT2003]|uniref:TRAP transporter large permease protein n=1 Tax=Oceaniovalibus guishaninsula JLT2003 TaxID=1231392 RepID=K2HGU3_9RHOB|nr:TRAP transporter large permease [Oceaniovalibus guishaninsula]EKE45657.1 TRAP dicarboxylate transporter, DctM subunit [Oceaniovalibus guishaninsula JLT2003]
MLTATLAIVILLLLCFIGVRIGVATLLVGFFGFALERGLGPAMQMSGQRILEDAMNYNLSVIPLFVLMGVFIYRSNVSDELYQAAHARFRNLRGGLAHSTVVACAGFGAVCGSSLATAATMTKVAMPSMRRFGYRDSLSTGVISAGGTLGIMIPPSVPLVIYGIVAEQDIGRLFLAGMIPGLLLVLLFMGTVAIWTRIDPEAAPSDTADEPGPDRRAGRAVLPIIGLFVLVLGGIYGKIFTPTEAAGIGAVGAAVIAMTRGRLLTPGEWIDSLAEAMSTTAALFLVIFGALIFADYANYIGLPFLILDAIDALDLGPFGLVVAITVIAILMGMVFEAIGILLLLVPVFMPALLDADVDLIWFGIIIVLVIEMGLITPPVGMNVFVVKSILTDADLMEMFRGVLPFVVAMLVALCLILIFPQIVTAIPDLIY